MSSRCAFCFFRHTYKKKRKNLPFWSFLYTGNPLSTHFGVGMLLHLKMLIRYVSILILISVLLALFSKLQNLESLPMLYPVSLKWMATSEIRSNIVREFVKFFLKFLILFRCSYIRLLNNLELLFVVSSGVLCVLNMETIRLAITYNVVEYCKSFD